MMKFVSLLICALALQMTCGYSIRSLTAVRNLGPVKFPDDVSTTLDTRQVSGNINLTPTDGNGGLQGASITVLRRGTDMVADSLVTALGGVASLMNILQNLSQTGRLQLGNLSSSAQLLTGRLVNMGVNAASSIMQQLSDEISGQGTGSTLVSPGGQISSTIGTPIDQLSRQFGITGTSSSQPFGFTSSSGANGLGGVFRQGLGSITSRLQSGGSPGILQSLGISGTEGNTGLSSLLQSVLGPLELSYAAGMQPDVTSGEIDFSSPSSSIDSAPSQVAVSLDNSF